jgi:hypothetical protein
LKTDRQIRDISDRLYAISSSNNGNGDNNGNGNGHNNGHNKRDDDYYLNLGRDPPRFYLYRQARAEKWEESGPHAPSDYDMTVTEDELAYALKRRLRITPEQRYQDEKRESWFHELYVEGGRECNNLYDPCCIPGHCRFADEYGVITDEEVIEDHNKLVEYYRRNNKIVEPPTEIEMQRLADACGFDLV